MALLSGTNIQQVSEFQSPPAKK